MLFKLRISFQQLVFILKIIEQWLLFHNSVPPFENLVFEPSLFTISCCCPLLSLCTGNSFQKNPTEDSDFIDNFFD
jgi:hypothetical protein